MTRLRIFPLLILPAVFALSAERQTGSVRSSGIETNLRGLSTADDGRGGTVVWASGSHGVVMISTDQGKRWKRLWIDGGQDLDFRGVVAWSGSTAYVMSSGEGAKSRIYKTGDGGASWQLEYSDAQGVLSGRARLFVGNRLLCVRRSNRWEVRAVAQRGWRALGATEGRQNATGPAAGGAFAASNSCLFVDATGVYFVTGGKTARMFHSADSGATWSVSELPLASGNDSSGAFSIAVSGRDIVVTGGDYKSAGESAGSAAYSRDGGATWQPAARPPGGFRSAVAAYGGSFIAVGSNGSDSSDDHGRNWKRVDQGNWNAVTAGKSGTWAVGTKGTVARFARGAR